MKLTAPLTAAIVLATAAFSQAEPPKVNHVVALLEDAKSSATPLPLLEKAAREFKDFKGSPVHAKKGGKALARAQNSENEALAKHRREAEAKIGQAVETAKAGGNPQSQINAAIAEVHLTGAYKR